MREAYPKNPEEIMIEEEKSFLDDGFVTDRESRELPLSEKLEDYMLRIGISSPHVTSICIQLLTQGKVKVDFRNYSERLSLMQEEDAINRPQAATLLDDYIRVIENKNNSQEASLNTTQRLVIQPRKR